LRRDSKPSRGEAFADTVDAGSLHTVGVIEAPTEDEVTVRRALEQLTSADRFKTTRVLGVGGMSVVYEATDRQLQRTVAIKVLKSDGQDDSASARARLIREAKALAKVSHANVIRIYEVGEVGGVVYIVMERVEGVTLTEWLTTEHTVAEILTVAIEIGDALAASHDAGVVHCDVKPSNVLIDRDGRVRVIDFGLAAPRSTIEVEAGAAGTQVRRMVGTPGYMAPEVTIGLAPTDRSDQYSFGVVLYEALSGRRPATLDTVSVFALSLDGAAQPGAAAVAHAAREATQLSGPRAHDPGINRVARRLRPILRRALAADPADRYASMHDLVGALRALPRARRRLALAIGGLVVVGAIGVVVALGRRDAAVAEGCDDLAVRARAWETAAQERLRTRLEILGRADAGDLRRGLERGAERWQRSFAARTTEACEATRARGDQSEEVLTRREVCFDRVLAERARFQELLEVADPRQLERAIRAMDAVDDADACGPAGALEAGEPAIEADLSRAKLLLELGEVTAAKAARSAVPKPAELGAAQRARAALFDAALAEVEGNLVDAETHLMAAMVAAEAAKDERLEIRARTRLARVVGVGLGRTADGLTWGALAENGLGHASAERRMHAEVVATLGSLHAFERRPEEAGRRYAEALGYVEGEPDLGALRASIGLANARALARLGRVADARTQLEQALTLQEAHFGASQPALAEALLEAAELELELAAPERAAPAIERARGILVTAYGADAPELAPVLEAEAALALARGDVAVAMTAYGAIARVDPKALDRQRRLRAQVRFGEALAAAGHRDEATAVLSAVIEAAKDDDSALVLLADAQAALGKLQLTRPALLGQAIDTLLEAHSIRVVQRMPGFLVADTEFALARALQRQGDAAASLGYATSALRRVRAIGSRTSKPIAVEIAGWIGREHGAGAVPAEAATTPAGAAAAPQSTR
jgi:predicted Ser/Thr protein kinase/tetratricopeptide (TPR) repeat protein